MSEIIRWHNEDWYNPNVMGLQQISLTLTSRTKVGNWQEGEGWVCSFCTPCFDKFRCAVHLVQGLHCSYGVTCLVTWMTLSINFFLGFVALFEQFLASSKPLNCVSFWSWDAQDETSGVEYIAVASNTENVCTSPDIKIGPKKGWGFSNLRYADCEMTYLPLVIGINQCTHPYSQVQQNFPVSHKPKCSLPTLRVFNNEMDMRLAWL